MIIYKGVKYFVIADDFGGIMEIAPTKHGAGSFYVLTSSVERV